MVTIKPTNNKEQINGLTTNKFIRNLFSYSFYICRVFCLYHLAFCILLLSIQLSIVIFGSFLFLVLNFLLMSMIL